MATVSVAPRRGFRRQSGADVELTGPSSLLSWMLYTSSPLSSLSCTTILGRLFVRPFKADAVRDFFRTASSWLLGEDLKARMSNCGELALAGDAGIALRRASRGRCAVRDPK